MKHAIRIAVAIFAALTFSLSAFAAENAESLKGKPAPAWELKKPDGTSVSLSSLKGKVVLLDFWATWCGPCKAAMPALQKIHEMYAKKGVQIIGINAWEEDPTSAIDYMKKNKYSYGLLLNGDAVAADYGVTGIPTMVVVDKKGMVSEVKVGYDRNLEAKLSAILDALLK